jgi:hypothetical protein
MPEMRALFFCARLCTDEYYNYNHLLLIILSTHDTLYFPVRTKTESFFGYYIKCHELYSLHCRYKYMSRVSGVLIIVIPK